MRRLRRYGLCILHICFGTPNLILGCHFLCKGTIVLNLYYNKYQGVEDISLDEVNGSDEDEDNSGGFDNAGVGGCKFDELTAINGREDLYKVNFRELNTVDLLRYHFPDVEVAFMFYNWYAGTRGFAARKSRYMRNKKGEITQKTFLCYREGQRGGKQSVTSSGQKREPKYLSRCGCEAKCQVHIDGSSGRWFIKYLNDEHNHTMVDEKYVGMLLAHRKISEYDIMQMNEMRKVGIRTPHIYGYIASQAGGYENVGFTKRDVYNEGERQKNSHMSDAKAALCYLDSMRSDDDMMFWKHTVDAEGRLEHLFWCDGGSRRDYLVFGDVLAFDATYRKNKYMCPLVVFSGVNHHNQTIVFASAIVGNETEETYVWLLECFMEAMDGKSPTSVITDGDLAMRNVIKKVFPRSHHRLCAWHLIRNATSNVGNVRFIGKLRQCMLGDYDIGEFKLKWEWMIAEFGLEDNNWVRELYAKRKMWATAHIRGKFFAGFRTTSRCESLHAEFGRYVNIHNNLMDFLKHFFRCLNYMRYKEVEADFESVHGEPVLQTQLQGLESSAASLYTKEVFMLFRPVLQRAYTTMVDGYTKTATSYIYTVTKYRRDGFEWYVSYCPSSLELKCSCMRMESMGIPCEHLIVVMMKLNIVNLPECLVLNRWRKNAKDAVFTSNDGSCNSWDPSMVGQYLRLVERFKRMAKAVLKNGRPEHIRSIHEYIESNTKVFEAVESQTGVEDINPSIPDILKNPMRVRTKGCGGASSSGGGKGRKKHACTICREEGHNRKSCPLQRQKTLLSQSEVEPNSVCINDPGGWDEEFDCDNIDTVKYI